MSEKQQSNLTQKTLYGAKLPKSDWTGSGVKQEFANGRGDENDSQQACKS